MPRDEKFRKEILVEAHNTLYLVHHGSTKMCYEIK